MSFRQEVLLGQDPSNSRYFFALDSSLLDLHLPEVKRVVVEIVLEGLRFHAAIVRSKVWGPVVFIGQKMLKARGLVLGRRYVLSLSLDDSPYQFEVPESFEVLLAEDELAYKIFSGLTAGRQRSIIYLVAQIKGLDGQIARGLKILENLKRGKRRVEDLLKD